MRLDGPRTQGGLLRGRVPPGSTVEYAGDAVRVSKDGWFLVGFGRDAPPEAELVVVFPDGFRWPAKGRISGVYGSQRILNGEPRRPHFGVEVAAPTGTEVSAPADGVVTLVHPDVFFSGGTLILDHGHGLSSAFLHLSRILVEKGERVVQGQLIAEIGETGRATGPHLDWRMNLLDRRIDPALLVGPMPKWTSSDSNCHQVAKRGGAGILVSTLSIPVAFSAADSVRSASAAVNR